ncbi:MAG: lipopolysaccharide kinase InaA family protein [Muribaculaceae bacterium]
MIKTKIVINPRYEHLRDYITSIPSKNGKCGAIIYDARNKIYQDVVEKENVSIKCFRTPLVINRVIYTFFRHSKARRSFDNGVKLTELGVGTATPIAYIEVYKDLLIEKSYYICEMLVAHDIRWWDKILNCEEVLDHAAQFMAELHEKGVFHKDFSPGNILYDDNFNFYLIDINRMKFNITNHHLLMENFKCLHDSPEETARIARLYAKHANATDVDAIVGEALTARRTYKEKQALKRRIKTLFKHKRYG